MLFFFPAFAGNSSLSNSCAADSYAINPFKKTFVERKKYKKKNENFHSSTCNLRVSIFYEILLENSGSFFSLYLLVSLFDFKQFDIERRIKETC